MSTKGLRLCGQRATTALATPVLVLAAVIGCSSLPTMVPVTTDTADVTTDTADQPVVPPHAAQDPAGLPRSVPVRVEIPRIGVASTLVPLGLNPDQTVQVPPLSKPMQAGWYEPGPTPGELGPAVILGHVDGHSGVGVFFRLRDVRPGYEILVTREDGAKLRFVIYLVEQVPKSSFPTEKVYGHTNHPELRLITCAGSFDSSSSSYRDNIIVYTKLVR